MNRWLLIAGGVAAAVILFALLRPNDDESSTTATVRTTTGGATMTATTTARPQQTVVRITVRDGRVVGGPMVHSVSKDDRVVIVVRSNVADEVHVHGYDLKRNVPAGGTARIAFRAKVAGRFEMELEENGLPLGELEVLP